MCQGQNGRTDPWYTAAELTPGDHTTYRAPTESRVDHRNRTPHSSSANHTFRVLCWGRCGCGFTNFGRRRAIYSPHVSTPCPRRHRRKGRRRRPTPHEDPPPVQPRHLATGLQHPVPNLQDVPPFMRPAARRPGSIAATSCEWKLSLLTPRMLLTHTAHQGAEGRAASHRLGHSARHSAGRTSMGPRRARGGAARMACAHHSTRGASR